MRVGLGCPYSLDVPGGVQNHVLGLADTLRRSGHDVSVLAPSESRTTAPVWYCAAKIHWLSWARTRACRGRSTWTPKACCRAYSPP